jgi:hypothetical protein
MTDETAAIRAAVQTYLDGLYEGDADKLASIFHATSALTWEEAGVLTPLPRDQWLEAARPGLGASSWARTPRPDPSDRSGLANDGVREAQVPDPTGASSKTTYAS